MNKKIIMKIMGKLGYTIKKITRTILRKTLFSKDSVRQQYIKNLENKIDNLNNTIEVQKEIIEYMENNKNYNFLDKFAIIAIGFHCKRVQRKLKKERNKKIESSKKSNDSIFIKDTNVLDFRKES